MKLLLVFCVIYLACLGAYARQTEPQLSLPASADVVNISISPPLKRGFTAQTLRQALSHFNPLYGEKLCNDTQRGTFTLRDGAIVKWTSCLDSYITLRSGGKEQSYIVDTSYRFVLPKPEDVAKIEIAPSEGDWFTSATIAKALPQFVRNGRYENKNFQQTGTFVLNDGTTLYWRAEDRNTLSLYHGKISESYVIPSTLENNAAILSQIPRELSLTGSVDGKVVEMSLIRTGENLNGSYYFTRTAGGQGVNSKGTIGLQGTIDAKGNIELIESGTQRVKSGQFNGVWNIDLNKRIFEIHGVKTGGGSAKKVKFSVDEPMPVSRNLPLFRNARGSGVFGYQRFECFGMLGGEIDRNYSGAEFDYCFGPLHGF